MQRSLRVYVASLAALGGLGLSRVAAAGPEEQQGFDLPPQSLAVGDAVGRAIFERDGRRVVLPPRAVQERMQQRRAQAAPPAAPAPGLPAWPAKWGGEPDAAGSY